ncbi:hypothetical protein VKS41_009322 [Umbelopsis sp. WA50703]
MRSIISIIFIISIAYCDYIEIADYVAQSPKYGAFARAPGPYDSAKARAQTYIDGLKKYADNYQPLINDGAKAGYKGKGSHLMNADYVLDSQEEFRTAFDHLVKNRIDGIYTVPEEFRFDTVGIRNNKKVYKIECIDHYEIYSIDVFPNMAFCNSINMVDVFDAQSTHLGMTYDRGECRIDTGNGKGIAVYFTSKILGVLVETPAPKTLVDFIMQSSYWMKKLGIINKSGAYDYVENMEASKKLYDQIIHEYSYWKVTETKLSIETKERNTPFNPTLTGNKVQGESGFIALTSDSSGGFLSTQMEIALKSGNTVIGNFKTINPLIQWAYTITATDGKMNGNSPSEFMKGAVKPSKEGIVTDEYVTHSIVTNLAYRKKGTCNVKLEAVDKITIKGGPRDSPQYNNKEGKEMVPVHYVGGSNYGNS